MPRYEFRCRECSDTFEVNRPMSESSDPANCPAGHTDTAKLLSTVAFAGSSRGGGGGVAGASSMPAMPQGGGGGCCGGGCH